MMKMFVVGFLSLAMRILAMRMTNIISTLSAIFYVFVYFSCCTSVFFPIFISGKDVWTQKGEGKLNEKQYSFGLNWDTMVDWMLDANSDSNSQQTRSRSSSGLSEENKAKKHQSSDGDGQQNDNDNISESTTTKSTASSSAVLDGVAFEVRLEMAASQLQIDFDTVGFFDKIFLDVGSGSGLNSLAAASFLGARAVVSVDVQEASLIATHKLRNFLFYGDMYATDEQIHEKFLHRRRILYESSIRNLIREFLQSSGYAEGFFARNFDFFAFDDADTSSSSSSSSTGRQLSLSEEEKDAYLSEMVEQWKEEYEKGFLVLDKEQQAEEQSGRTLFVLPPELQAMLDETREKLILGSSKKDGKKSLSSHRKYFIEGIGSVEKMYDGSFYGDRTSNYHANNDDNDIIDSSTSTTSCESDTSSTSSCSTINNSSGYYNYNIASNNYNNSSKNYSSPCECSNKNWCQTDFVEARLTLLDNSSYIYPFTHAVVDSPVDGKPRHWIIAKGSILDGDFVKFLLELVSERLGEEEFSTSSLAAEERTFRNDDRNNANINDSVNRIHRVDSDTKCSNITGSSIVSSASDCSTSCALFSQAEHWQQQRELQRKVVSRQKIATTRKFDFVYSYGVLMHTGDVELALRNIAQLVQQPSSNNNNISPINSNSHDDNYYPIANNDAGRLFVALYNRHYWPAGRDSEWLEMKEEYLNAPLWAKRLWEVSYQIGENFEELENHFKKLDSLGNGILFNDDSNSSNGSSSNIIINQQSPYYSSSTKPRNLLRQLSRTKFVRNFLQDKFRNFAVGRGMSYFIDARDSLGGYPVEYITESLVTRVFDDLNTSSNQIWERSPQSSSSTTNSNTLWRIVNIDQCATTGFLISPAGKDIAVVASSSNNNIPAANSNEENKEKTATISDSYTGCLGESVYDRQLIESVVTSANSSGDRKNRIIAKNYYTTENSTSTSFRRATTTSTRLVDMDIGTRSCYGLWEDKRILTVPKSMIMPFGTFLANTHALKTSFEKKEGQQPEAEETNTAMIEGVIEALWRVQLDVSGEKRGRELFKKTTHDNNSLFSSLVFSDNNIENDDSMSKDTELLLRKLLPSKYSLNANDSDDIFNNGSQDSNNNGEFDVDGFFLAKALDLYYRESVFRGMKQIIDRERQDLLYKYSKIYLQDEEVEHNNVFSPGSYDENRTNNRERLMVAGLRKAVQTRLEATVRNIADSSSSFNSNNTSIGYQCHVIPLHWIFKKLFLFEDEKNDDVLEQQGTRTSKSINSNDTIDNTMSSSTTTIESFPPYLKLLKDGKFLGFSGHQPKVDLSVFIDRKSGRFALAYDGSSTTDSYHTTKSDQGESALLSSIDFCGPSVASESGGSGGETSTNSGDQYRVLQVDFRDSGWRPGLKNSNITTEDASNGTTIRISNSHISSSSSSSSHDELTSDNYSSYTHFPLLYRTAAIVMKSSAITTSSNGSSPVYELLLQFFERVSDETCDSHPKYAHFQFCKRRRMIKALYI